MQHIKGFLLDKKINTEENKNIIIACIKEISGVSLEKNQVRFFDKKIYIQTNPITKTKISFKKDEILLSLQKKKETTYYTDIQ